MKNINVFKSLCGICFVIACTGYASAAEEYIHKEPVASYYRNFDTAGAADQILVDGLAGKALTTGVDLAGKRKTLNLVGNILPTVNGTVMLWFRQTDWQSRNGLRFFFDARGKGNQLFILNSFEDGKHDAILLTLKIKGSEYFIRKNFDKITPGRWHQIAVTYDNSEFRLYFDGKCVQAANIPQFAEPFSHFFLGGDAGWTQGVNGSMDVDEFAIYPKSLSEDEILFLFNKYAKNFTPDVESLAQVNQSMPVLDGVINPHEYSMGGTGFTDMKTGFYSSLQSNYYLGYDNDYLYFAIKSPVMSKLVTEKTVADSNVWEDDSVELHIDTAGNNYFQFIINSAGIVYDSRNKDANWNGNVKIETSVNDGIWSCEAAIPLKSLGLSISPGTLVRMNVCRSFKNENLYTASSPGRGMYDMREIFGKYIFQKNPLSYEIVSLGNLNQNNLDFKMIAKSLVADDLTVRLESPRAMHPYVAEEKIVLSQDSTAEKQIAADDLPANNTLINTINSGKYGKIFSGVLTYQKMEPLKFSHIYTDIPEGILNIVCRRGNISSGMKMRVVMKDKHSGETVFDKMTPLKSDTFIFTVNYEIADLPSGDFDMLIEVIDPAGNVVLSQSEYYMKPDAALEWLQDGSKGVSEKVPAPWTAPVFDNNKLFCWGREVTLGNGGLISSIISNGRELLAAPMNFGSNGSRSEVQTIGLKEKTESNAIYEFSAKNGNIDINGQIKVDFDGFMLFDVTLSPAVAGENVRDFFLEIPVARNEVDAFDNNQSYRIKNILAKTKFPIYTDLSVMPSIWVGNMDRGINWGAKNLKGWYLKNKSSALVISETPKSYILRFNIIDTPLVMNGSRQIRFYLQPTPVKPVSKAAKNLRHMDNYYINAGEYWVTRYENHKEEFLNKSWANTLKQKDSPDYNVFFYSATCGASPFSAEWHYFSKLWHSPLPRLGEQWGDMNSANRNSRDYYAYTNACLDEKSFFNYKFNNLVNMMEKLDINNLYCDISWPKMCGNSEHGCGWTDEFGVEQSSLSVLGTREYYKRMYNVIKDKNPNGIIAQHLLGTTRTPAESFTDLLLFGEVYEHDVPSRESYYGIFTPDAMRVAYAYRTGEQACAMIKQFSRGLAVKRPERYKTWNPLAPQEDRAVRHFIGYCMLNDIEVFPEYWLKPDAFKRPFELYDAEKLLADYAGGTFYPYWNKENSPLVVTSDKGVMVSCRISGSKMLLTALNDTDSTAGCSIEFKKFPAGKAAGIFDPGKEDLYTINSGVLKLNFKPREAKILIVE